MAVPVIGSVSATKQGAPEAATTDPLHVWRTPCCWHDRAQHQRQISAASARAICGKNGCISGKLRGMAGRTERNDGERIRALQVVGYELRMMAHASDRLRQAQLADDDGMTQNAYLESALLHARALTAFLLRRSKPGSDIRRTDFAPEWTPTPPEAVKRLNDHYLLLHKYLAHLTWERVSKDAPVWDYPNIATDVIDVADAWSAHLESADRPMWEVLRPHVLLARRTLTR
jgi:hypothetical protein